MIVHDDPGATTRPSQDNRGCRSALQQNIGTRATVPRWNLISTDLPRGSHGSLKLSDVTEASLRAAHVDLRIPTEGSLE